jgi:hypothetical protein
MVTMVRRIVEWESEAFIQSSFIEACSERGVASDAWR